MKLQNRLGIKEHVGVAAVAACVLALFTQSATADIAVHVGEETWRDAVGSNVVEENLSGPTWNGVSAVSDTGAWDDVELLWEDHLERGKETRWVFEAGTRAAGARLTLDELNGPEAGLAIELIDAHGNAHLVQDELFNWWGGAFIGFVADFDISAVIFRVGTQGGDTESYRLDDIRYVSANIPEPATLGLLAIGALLTLRRQRAAT